MGKKGKDKIRRRYIAPGFSQRSFERPTAHTKPPKSLLIVTEGGNTEPLYLNAIAQHWSLHPHVTRVEPGGEGIPQNRVRKALTVKLERAKQHRAGKLAFNQTAGFDETWIVFDTDHAEKMGRLSSGIEYAKQHDVRIAHSTPCFEFWLCLHYALKAPPMSACSEAERLFEQVAKLPPNSYSKKAGASKEIIDCLLTKVRDAVRHAKTLTNQQAADDFPPNPSTSVQDLIKSMWEALPDELKKRFPMRS